MPALLSALYLLLTSSPIQASDKTCLPRFGPQKGWLGADVAYSIPLDGKRDLWLFGDTFVGRPGQTTRDGAHMVPNTVGVSECRNGRWSIRYHWKNKGDDDPRKHRAFFESGTDGHRFWPQDGLLHDGKLFIALSMVADKPGDGGQFGFLMAGVKMAVVENPREPLDAWRVRLHDLASTDAALPGASLVKSGEHAYFFTVLKGSEGHPITLTRVRLDDLQSAAAKIERLSRDGTWKKGLGAADAKILMTLSSPEMTVRHRPALGGWVAVSTGAEGFPSRRIAMRTSRSLEGPWSQEREIHRFPEMQPGSPAYDKDTFCAAVKEHPQYETARHELALTYTCNSFSFPTQVRDMRLYFPISARVDLAKPPRP